MQASFTPEEQQLIERLKEKYGGQPGSTHAGDHEDVSCIRCEASASTAPAASAAASASSSVEASICPHCHGTGTLTEIYNHRRLENFCKDCEGRGVRVFKHGVEVKQGAIGGDAHTSHTAKAPAGVAALNSRTADQGGMGLDQMATAAERKADLECELQRIAAKTALYTKERLDALAVLQHPCGSCTDPEGRDVAARELVAQLDLQLERLELARCKKQQALERLQRATAVTLGDVIANEGVTA